MLNDPTVKSDSQLISISKRAAAAKPFLVMDMFHRATELEAVGEDVIHLAAGQPGGAAPARVIEAAKAALDNDKIGYTASVGLISLRQRIAQYYQDTHAVEIDPARVIVTTGSSGSFVLTFLAAFDAGARVGLAAPGYPAYRNIFSSLGIEVVDIPVNASQRWVPSLQQIEAAADAGLDGLLIASPANPTGTMVSPDHLAAMIKTCERRNIRFISDEIYHGLHYSMPQASALQTSGNVIVINSFSKYYCMTGWRIGWMVAPEEMVRGLEILAQNLFISAPTLSQLAAIAAFDAIEELEQRKAQYQANRDFLLAALPQIGMGDCAPVDGAFYIYTDVSRFTNDSGEFARRMLAETGIATTPGADFDIEQGQKYLRLSFAGGHQDIERAVERLASWLK